MASPSACGWKVRRRPLFPHSAAEYAAFAGILSLAFLPSGLSPYRDAIVFALLIAFLLLRPNGLLRATQEVKL